MTMTPAELERKVHQLDNDVQSIYEMLTGIEGTQRRHGNRLQELADQLGALDTKVDALDSKVSELDTKVGALDTKVSGLDATVGGLDTKADEILRLVRDGGR